MKLASLRFNQANSYEPSLALAAPLIQRYFNSSIPIRFRFQYLLRGVILHHPDGPQGNHGCSEIIR